MTLMNDDTIKNNVVAVEHNMMILIMIVIKITT